MGWFNERTQEYRNGDQQFGDIEYPAPPGANYIPDGAGGWSKPIDIARVDQLASINKTCTDLLAAVKAGYPDAEVESWSKQESEARAYVADNTAATPLLTALSTAREVPLPDLAARVIEKADLFATASGEIIGTRQRCEDLIMAATSSDAVTAISWPV